MSLFRLACSCIVDAERTDVISLDDAAPLDGRSPTTSPHQSRRLHDSSFGWGRPPTDSDLPALTSSRIQVGHRRTPLQQTCCCDDSPNESRHIRPILPRASSVLYAWLTPSPALLQLHVWRCQSVTVQCVRNTRRRHYVLGSSLRPAVHPLTPISRDAISMYLVEGFQWNLQQIFIM